MFIRFYTCGKLHAWKKVSACAWVYACAIMHLEEWPAFGDDPKDTPILFHLKAVPTLYMENTCLLFSCILLHSVHIEQNFHFVYNISFFVSRFRKEFIYLIEQSPCFVFKVRIASSFITPNRSCMFLFPFLCFVCSFCFSCFIFLRFEFWIVRHACMQRCPEFDHLWTKMKQTLKNWNQNQEWQETKCKLIWEVMQTHQKGNKPHTCIKENTWGDFISEI